MPVWLQVLFSLLLVAAVFWSMWRLPPEKGQAFIGWAPWLALMSPWSGLAALICATATWFTAAPDRWLALLFLLLTPAAVASGSLVYWIHRGQLAPPDSPITRQRVQAGVGITLGLLAVTLGYALVFIRRAPDPIF